MNMESTRAAAAATAPLRTPASIYDSTHYKSSTVDEILATLMIGLAVRHHAMAERVLVIGKIERLLRRKIELGLLKGDGRDG